MRAAGAGVGRRPLCCAESQTSRVFASSGFFCGHLMSCSITGVERGLVLAFFQDSAVGSCLGFVFIAECRGTDVGGEPGCASNSGRAEPVTLSLSRG